jgi:hypothetical protein
LFGAGDILSDNGGIRGWSQGGYVSQSSSRPVSELLGKWQAGDSEALRALIPLVYTDLRHLAHQYLRKERPAHTLQSAALVHEAYLRLTKRKKVHFGDALISLPFRHN